MSTEPKGRPTPKAPQNIPPLAVPATQIRAFAAEIDIAVVKYAETGNLPLLRMEFGIQGGTVQIVFPAGFTPKVTEAMLDAYKEWAETPEAQDAIKRAQAASAGLELPQGLVIHDQLPEEIT